MLICAAAVLHKMSAVAGLRTNQPDSCQSVSMCPYGFEVARREAWAYLTSDLVARLIMLGVNIRVRFVVFYPKVHGIIIPYDTPLVLSTPPFIQLGFYFRSRCGKQEPKERGSPAIR